MCDMAKEEYGTFQDSQRNFMCGKHVRETSNTLRDAQQWWSKTFSWILRQHLGHVWISGEHWNLVFTIATLVILIPFYIGIATGGYRVLLFLPTMLLVFVVSYVCVRFGFSDSFLLLLVLLTVASLGSAYSAHKPRHPITFLSSLQLFVVIAMVLIVVPVVQAHFFKRVDKYGVFSCLWGREIGKHRYEFVLVDGNGEIVWVRFVSFPRFFLRASLSSVVAKNYLRAIKKERGEWIRCFPVLLRERELVVTNFKLPDLDGRRKYKVRHYSSLSIFQKIAQVTSAYIPTCVEDTVLIEGIVPNLTENEWAMFLRSPLAYPKEPPARDESLLSQRLVSSYALF